MQDADDTPVYEPEQRSPAARPLYTADTFMRAMTLASVDGDARASAAMHLATLDPVVRLTDAQRGSAYMALADRADALRAALRALVTEVAETRPFEDDSPLAAALVAARAVLEATS